MVEDGILTNVSVGYRINKMDKDSKGHYRATSWTPLEVSFVGVPADTSVGLGRSEQGDLNANEDKPIQQEIRVMSDELNLDAVREEAARQASKDTAEMYRLAEKHNKRGLADEAVREGKSLTDFCIELARDLPGNMPLDTVEVGLGEKRFANTRLCGLFGPWLTPLTVRPSVLLSLSSRFLPQHRLQVAAKLLAF